jgi:uncharacterized protein (TIGR02996 family)
MDTEAAFLRSIEADLADPAPLLIYADWLEEQGKDQLAHTWRWMARRSYRPARRERLGPRVSLGRGRHESGARVFWAWWHAASLEGISDAEERADLKRHPEARLPVLLFRAMGAAGPHIYCPTLIATVERLARGFEVFRELAALERQPGDP